ncbi:hypothetical protein [Microcystis sp. M061S2]|uniref:hypothetical protein n=1 Tax=Microcystis sp. M061S2 TaxID=2771171 RepID=UPI00258B93BA|nr:hypothetical protein [Microcystis sp. M061S2]MCA2656878.1 hypothetical protein [Microcystis sp. M061S2]
MPRIVISGSGGGGGGSSGPTPTFIDSLPFGADFVGATYPVVTQEVYFYRTGGSGGTLVQTATVNYVDAFKDNILNVTLV